MPILNCYVDDRTLEILTKLSGEMGRTIEDLAESAISEAAIQAKRDEHD
jgi:hypothetical protein